MPPCPSYIIYYKCLEYCSPFMNWWPWPAVIDTGKTTLMLYHCSLTQDKGLDVVSELNSVTGIRHYSFDVAGWVWCKGELWLRELSHLNSVLDASVSLNCLHCSFVSILMYLVPLFRKT